MRLGIMQPYFFPYLGHFGLIAHCDQWIVFDITQYTRKTYMSRNEVLKASGGRQRIGVDLARSSTHMKTWQAQVANTKKTRNQVLGSLSHYKKSAPNYDCVVGLVQHAFDTLEMDMQSSRLVDLNIAGLRVVCEYLGLSFEYRIASDLSLNFENSVGPGGWAPGIAKELGAAQYLNPIGGESLFDPALFDDLGIELQFLEYSPIEYDTPGYQFEPNLSILDVLMWNSPEFIKQYVSGCCYVRSAKVGC